MADVGFIDEEHAETTYHPRYHRLYDHRYLTPGDLDELVRSAPAEVAGADRLAEAHALLYGDELKARMEAHRALQEDYRRVAPLVLGLHREAVEDVLALVAEQRLGGTDHLTVGVQHRGPVWSRHPGDLVLGGFAHAAMIPRRAQGC